MLKRLSSQTAVLALALVFAFLLASCEEETSKPSEKNAGVDAAGAVGSAMDSALNEEDQNPSTLSGGAGPGALFRLTRRLPGIGPATGGIQINALTSGGPQSASIIWNSSYPCSEGGMVAATGSATATWEWDNGAGTALAYWHETFTLNGVDLTLTDCGEDGYTLNGMAHFTATNAYSFDQTADQSSLYDFGFTIDEAATAAVVATHEASGADYDLDLAWTLAGTLDGQVDVISGESEVTAVDVTATYTINQFSCNGTWTDPNKGWDVTCQ